MGRLIASIALMLLAGNSANAALLSRMSGQAYYDTVLNITWLADANYAKTSGYDTDGLMTWSAAQAWIASLNAGSGYLGLTDWRLPTAIDTGTSGCDFAYTGTDCGYNVDLSTGEMAHLFYSTLGNVGFYDTVGVPTGCGTSSPNYCLTSTGPFSNLQSNIYWYRTSYAPATFYAWNFDFHWGIQDANPKSSNGFAWAVRGGDSPLFAPVPIPAAAWLFGGAFAGLGVLRHRQASA